MQVCVIGCGYVGLTTGAVLADLGHNVSCVDIDRSKISTLRRGDVPIYEPGLSRLIAENTASRRLSFSTEIRESIVGSSIVMIAVGTPPLPQGGVDLSALEAVVEDLGAAIKKPSLIITKSTVPPGTNDWVAESLSQRGLDEDHFDVVSNPEFLREGSALADTMNPDRIVVGARTPSAVEIVRDLYRGIDAPYIVTNLAGAEMIKYAANAFLATKISFINEIAKICDACGVSVEDVASGIGADHRIGPHFLRAGLGYGGSCLPKDIRALTHFAEGHHQEPHLLKAAETVNNLQIDVYLNKLLKEVLKNKGTLEFSNLQITVWGLAFKPLTDDTRSSPALRLVKRLVDTGCQVRTFDPVARATIEGADSCSKQYRSLQGSQALVVATEWNDFVEANWSKVLSKMDGRIVLDTRNCLDPAQVQRAGLEYLAVGRP